METTLMWDGLVEYIDIGGFGPGKATRFTAVKMKDSAYSLRCVNLRCVADVMSIIVACSANCLVFAMWGALAG
jgi:hypothetical protein